MKVTAAYTVDPSKKKEEKKEETSHPRKYIDEQLAKNYPGKNLEELDTHRVPVIPGVEDTPAMAALRRGYKPSMPGGPHSSTRKK